MNFLFLEVKKDAPLLPDDKLLEGGIQNER